MIETALIIGGFGLITPVLIYHTRKILQIEAKVDLIYKNLDIAVKWIENNHK